NFLIGNGERLTHNVEVPTSSGPKNMPYDFATTQKRIKNDLNKTYEYFKILPDDVCPNNESLMHVLSLD
ncbi:unnamed protein product, partial [marine sediment metagenome]